ncbi:MAG: TonB-dependent receptor [Gammaproteobacteria bacterium]|nr:TonB-dependent receptor [Gammaproteobacteria bacterium]
MRLAWTPRENQLVWSALARGVRAPARLDRDVFIPGTAPFAVGGGPDFPSEIAEVVELGYRVQPTSALSYSITAFHHRYDRLRSLELAPPDGEAVTIVGNGIEGDVAGIEAWGAWQATNGWQLRLGGFLMDQDLDPGPGSAAGRVRHAGPAAGAGGCRGFCLLCG